MTEPIDSVAEEDQVEPATTSIASRLLKIIFGSYFAFALVVTVFQLLAEYRYTENRVNAEIQAMRQTFGPGIADAMWRFQDDVLTGILVGMNALPTVVGVKVLDPGGTMVRAIGTVLDQDGRHLLAYAGGAAVPVQAKPGYFAQVFGHEFPAVYVDEKGREREIGKWVVYSNQRVVMQQVQYGFLLIIVAAIIKAVALWFIFLFVVRRWLGMPLKALTRFVRHIDIHNLGTREFVLHGKARDELHFLGDTVNTAALKLHRAIQQNLQLYNALEREQTALKALNETLEQRVQERTAQLQEVNRQLAEMSHTDGLTEIANRRRFDEVLANEWSRAERTGQPLAIALLDVDWFKKYNDHYGHVAGDECLRLVARVLTACVKRAGELVARIGGEEFAIVVPAAGEGGAKQIAQTICESVQAHAIPHQLSDFGRVTVSIGIVSMIPVQGASPSTLLELADQALYRAKSQGRNRVVEHPITVS